MLRFITAFFVLVLQLNWTSLHLLSLISSWLHMPWLTSLCSMLLSQNLQVQNTFWGWELSFQFLNAETNLKATHIIESLVQLNVWLSWHIWGIVLTWCVLESSKSWRIEWSRKSWELQIFVIFEGRDDYSVFIQRFSNRSPMICLCCISLLLLPILKKAFLLIHFLVFRAHHFVIFGFLFGFALLWYFAFFWYCR